MQTMHSYDQEPIMLLRIFRLIFYRLDPFMVPAGEDRKYGIWLLQFLDQYSYCIS